MPTKHQSHYTKRAKSDPFPMYRYSDRDRFLQLKMKELRDSLHDADLHQMSIDQMLVQQPGEEAANTRFIKLLERHKDQWVKLVVDNANTTDAMRTAHQAIDAIIKDLK